MARITIAGNAAVITSSLKLEDLKTVAKNKPDALVLREGEDKQAVFAINIAKEDTGDIGQYGVVFDAIARNADGYATVTASVGDIGETDIKEYIADNYTAPLAKLEALEVSIPPVVEEINAQRNAVIDSITVI